LHAEDPKNMRFMVRQRHGSSARWVPAVVCFVTLLLSSARSSFAADPPATPPVPGIFESNMDRIFADGRADIRVVFGYDNYEGIKEPNDPARSKQFMRYLTSRSFALIAPTPELAASLGVPEDAANVRAYSGKTVDGRWLRVALIWSSLTTSTARNIGAGYIDQFKWSKVALNFMKKACAESEVMIYVGHSRGGGGPDTFPPEVLAGPNTRSQQVDYSYYRRNRPGLAALESTFAKAENVAPVIVWTGCQAHQHFCGWLTGYLSKKSQPTSLILSTRLTNHIPGAPEIVDTDESLMAAVSMMEALIFRESQPVLEKRLVNCEIPEKYDAFKPLWKITNVPGTKAKATDAVAAGQ
jgi:hypothetical protein